MSFTTEVEIRMCEQRIREIFAKPIITDDDVKSGNFFINKWKTLTNWVERTDLPIIFNYE